MTSFDLRCLEEDGEGVVGSGEADDHPAKPAPSSFDRTAHFPGNNNGNLLTVRDPYSTVVVNGVSLQFWQVAHIYGVKCDVDSSDAPAIYGAATAQDIRRQKFLGMFGSPQQPEMTVGEGPIDDDVRREAINRAREQRTRSGSATPARPPSVGQGQSAVASPDEDITTGRGAFDEQEMASEGEDEMVSKVAHLIDSASKLFPSSPTSHTQEARVDQRPHSGPEEHRQTIRNPPRPPARMSERPLIVQGRIPHPLDIPSNPRNRNGCIIFPDQTDPSSPIRQLSFIKPKGDPPPRPKSPPPEQRPPIPCLPPLIAGQEGPWPAPLRIRRSENQLKKMASSGSVASKDSKPSLLTIQTEKPDTGSLAVRHTQAPVIDEPGNISDNSSTVRSKMSAPTLAAKSPSVNPTPQQNQPDFTIKHFQPLSASKPPDAPEAVSPNAKNSISSAVGKTSPSVSTGETTRPHSRSRSNSVRLYTPTLSTIIDSFPSMPGLGKPKPSWPLAASPDKSKVPRDSLEELRRSAHAVATLSGSPPRSYKPIEEDDRKRTRALLDRVERMRLNIETSSPPEDQARPKSDSHPATATGSLLSSPEIVPHLHKMSSNNETIASSPVGMPVTPTSPNFSCPPTLQIASMSPLRLNMPDYDLEQDSWIQNAEPPTEHLSKTATQTDNSIRPSTAGAYVAPQTHTRQRSTDSGSYFNKPFIPSGLGIHIEKRGSNARSSGGATEFSYDASRHSTSSGPSTKRNSNSMMQHGDHSTADLIPDKRGVAAEGKRSMRLVSEFFHIKNFRKRPSVTSSTFEPLDPIQRTVSAMTGSSAGGYSSSVVSPTESTWNWRDKSYDHGDEQGANPPPQPRARKKRSSTLKSQYSSGIEEVKEGDEREEKQQDEDWAAAYMRVESPPKVKQKSKHKQKKSVSILDLKAHLTSDTAGGADLGLLVSHPTPPLPPPRRETMGSEGGLERPTTPEAQIIPSGSGSGPRGYRPTTMLKSHWSPDSSEGELKKKFLKALGVGEAKKKKKKPDPEQQQQLHSKRSSNNLSTGNTSMTEVEQQDEKEKSPGKDAMTGSMRSRAKTTSGSGGGAESSVRGKGGLNGLQRALKVRSLDRDVDEEDDDDDGVRPKHTLRSVSEQLSPMSPNIMAQSSFTNLRGFGSAMYLL